MGFNKAVTLTPTTRSSDGLVTGFLIKRSGGNLYNLTVCNNGSGTYEAQLFDAASEPADGTVPDAKVLIPGGNTATFTYDSGGRLHYSGIYACISSTQGYKTIATTADAIFDASFS